MAPCSYVLPLRSASVVSAAGFDDYLRWVSARAELLVVDGSAEHVFRVHAARWSSFARHLPVDPDLAAPNGKVAGVLTGIRHASHECVVLADDDVRYDCAALAAVVAALADAHVVRPQNFFAPLPWHARWDTGRILLNRALDGDWPGTLGIRRSLLLATGGYDGGVLFENLELVRTVVAAGGRVVRRDDLLVRRIPATARTFWSQRVRQAYDEFARPSHLAAQLSILPAAGLGVAVGAWRTLAAATACIMAMAEVGRRRAGGRRVFPASAVLMAPLWLLERGLCSWLALGSRMVRGGVGYHGGVLRRAATPMRVLRRRYAGLLASTSTSIGLNEPLLDSSAEHAVTPTTISSSARSSR